MEVVFVYGLDDKFAAGAVVIVGLLLLVVAGVRKGRAPCRSVELAAEG